MWRMSSSILGSATDMATASHSSDVISVPARPARPVVEDKVDARGVLAIVWERFRRHHFALVGVGALLFMLFAATLAPLAPWGPNEIDRSITDPHYMAHGFAPPSVAHWFGTDELNRD